MGPLNLTAEWGTLASWLTPLAIGIGFGAVLEMSGFGDSRKLAAQFYLKDLTVLKVMFTAIIVAAVLLGLSSALGLIDFDHVWVNPTYLVPGIVGGLVMGVGFIVGGFCPGTSVVASATLKLDGLVFLGGVAAGVFAFGETAGFFDGFWRSTAMGRFTLPDLLGVDAGWVLVGVVAMALFMFALAEAAEAWFGRGERPRLSAILSRRPMAIGAPVLLLALALTTAAIGQPDAEDRWEMHEAELGPKLADRSVFVHPREVAELLADTQVYTLVLDVRDESAFNLFHLPSSRRVAPAGLETPESLKLLKSAPDNEVIFIVSEGEGGATEAWKILAASGVQNVYVLEGGISRWREVFPSAADVSTHSDHPDFERKVKLIKKAKAAKGCG